MAGDRTQRRQICEKTVIDHLANEVFDPAATGGPGVGSQTGHSKRGA
jgi:hypothetical protein